MDNRQTETNGPLLRVQGLSKIFDISGGLLDQLTWTDGRLRRVKTTVKAINDVGFDVARGETFSVVGESGCGKSTLGRTVIGLYPPDAGEIHYDGQRIDTLSSRGMLPFRRRMQMVFQDPYASLNPRKHINQILEEPLRFHHPDLTSGELRDRVASVMDQVGGDPQWLTRLPHEFSGGQRQRISIARALVVDPEFIVADEPISALDVSIQAQILNLLMDAQEQRGLTYIFIAHDLSVVAHISTRVAVMYLGTLCEVATAADLFNAPRHPYTRALMSAIPRLGRKRPDHIRLRGEVPTPIHLPPGCVFHARCHYADDRCRAEIPRLRHHGERAAVACHGIEEGRI